MEKVDKIAEEIDDIKDELKYILLKHGVIAGSDLYEVYAAPSNYLVNLCSYRRALNELEAEGFLLSQTVRVPKHNYQYTVFSVSKKFQRR